MTSFPGSGVYKFLQYQSPVKRGWWVDRQTDADREAEPSAHSPRQRRYNPLPGRPSSQPSLGCLQFPAPDLRQLIGASGSPCAPPLSWRFCSAPGKVRERGVSWERVVGAPACPEVPTPRRAARPSSLPSGAASFQHRGQRLRLPADLAEWPRPQTRTPGTLGA